MRLPAPPFRPVEPPKGLAAPLQADAAAPPCRARLRVAGAVLLGMTTGLGAPASAQDAAAFAVSQDVKALIAGQAASAAQELAAPLGSHDLAAQGGPGGGAGPEAQEFTASDGQDFGVPPGGPDPTAAARSALRVLQSASEQLGKAEKARDRVAALTGVITAYEAGLSALRDGMRQVSIHEAGLARALAAEEARISRLIGALTTLEGTPQSLLMLHPSGPLDAVRAGMIMAEITPGVQAEAAGLRRRLDEVRQVRRLQSEALTQLGAGLREVQQARTALSQAISSRSPLPDGSAEKAAAAERLAEAARTLEDFLTGLQSGAFPVSALPDSLAPPLLPVQGRFLRGYGEADAAGLARPGWLFATQPQALVTAPAPATIRYLGPLLDYGKVMILEPEADTLLVLAGLGTVYGEVGQVVDAGDPLGLMGGTPVGAEVFMARKPVSDMAAAEGGGDGGAAEPVAGLGAGVGDSALAMSGEGGSSSRQAGQRSETLYFEVRRDGRTVDPGTWFEGTKDAN